MRPRLKQLSQAVAFFSLAFVLLAVFQNCSGFNADYNPLYDRDGASVCIGVSCAKSAEMITLSVANEVPLTVFKPDTLPVTACNSSTCLDVSGYCDTGGWQESQITHRWKQGGRIYDLDSNSVKTPGCDANGRFHVQARVPDDFNYQNEYELIITLEALENDLPIKNPVGLHEVTVRVSTVVPPQ